MTKFLQRGVEPLTCHSAAEPMNWRAYDMNRKRLLPLLALAACAMALWVTQVKAAVLMEPGNALIVAIEGQQVEVQRKGSPGWDRAYTHQVLHPEDQFRTGPRSRATLQFSDKALLPVAPRTQLRIAQPAGKRRILELLRGVIYFFHRDKPGELELRSPVVNAVVLGTEFNLLVADDGTTTLSLLDGQVQ